MSKTPACIISHSILLLMATPVFGQGFFASSLEQYNYQVGDNQLVLKSYDGFDEISDFPDVTGLSLSINGGTAENIPFDPFYGTYKRGKNYNTLAEMLAERPIDGSYAHTITGSPSGTVTITAPDVAYADGVPNHPVFTMNGVTGVWGRGPNGIGRFYFDPATTTTFTVTMNAYNATTQGGHYVYAVYVADIKNGFTRLEEYSSGLVEDGQTPVDIPPNLQLTFTKNDPAGALHTFQFTAGDRFEIEGEHVNVFGLAAAEIGTDNMKAFPYQTVTAFELVAVADPKSTMPTATDIAIMDQAVGAQDGVSDRFFLDWETTPAESPVDVYRSTDLTNWGSPVSSLNQAGSYSEPMNSNPKAFFLVVPSGDAP